MVNGMNNIPVKTEDYIFNIKNKIMKKYFLTILSDKKFTNEHCIDVGVALGTIVDSNFLNFNFSDNYIIFHFESEVNKSEIYTFVVGVLHGISDTFILTEMNDNVSVSLPSKINFMFDLENGGGDIMEGNKYFIDNDEYDEDDLDLYDIMETYRKNLAKNEKKPSLDFLLDKIKESGFDSLSETEKKHLEKYSKNLI